MFLKYISRSFILLPFFALLAMSLQNIQALAMPILQDDALTMECNTLGTMNILANDDPNGGSALSADGSSVFVPEGNIFINSSGFLSFTPTVGYSGSFQFPYTASNDLGSAEAKITFTVTGTCRPNYFGISNSNPDSFITPCGVEISENIVNNDNTDRSTRLELVEIGGNVHTPDEIVTFPEGTLTFDVDGNITFSPVIGYSGTLIFDFITSEERSGIVVYTQEVTITVEDCPTTNPIPEPEDYTVACDEVVRGNVLSNDDANGGVNALETFTVGGTTYNAGDVATLPEGALTIDVAGELEFTPVAGYSGNFTFDYTSTNGTSSARETSSATQISSITVEDCPGEPPVASPDSFTTEPGSAVLANIISSSDSDPDGDTLSVVDFTIGGTTYPAGITVNLPEGDLTIDVNGDLTFVPALGFSGDVPVIDYTITDGTNTVASQITITIAETEVVEDNATGMGEGNGDELIRTGGYDSGNTVSVSLFVLALVGYLRVLVDRLK